MTLRERTEGCLAPGGCEDYRGQLFQIAVSEGKARPNDTPAGVGVCRYSCLFDLNRLNQTNIVTGTDNQPESQPLPDEVAKL